MPTIVEMCSTTGSQIDPSSISSTGSGLSQDKVIVWSSTNESSDILVGETNETSTMSAFIYATKKSSPGEILKSKAIYNKDARRNARSKNDSRQLENIIRGAGKALPQVFGAAADFMPHDRNEFTEIDSTAAKYEGDLGGIKALGGKFYKYDLVTPFVIWKPRNITAANIGDCWEDESIGLNLMDHPSQFTMTKVCQWQKDFLGYGNVDDDTESIKLDIKCFQNSCHSTLLIQVNERYDAIDLIEQGGIVYLKIAFDLMFVMTHEVTMSLSA